MARAGQALGDAGDLLAAEELHPQEGEDDDEEEEQEEQADDGLHGVEEGHDQVPERRPVPARGGGRGQRRARPQRRPEGCPGTPRTYFVTLKMRSNLRARNTLIPNDVPGLMTAQMTSKMLPMMTWNPEEGIKLLERWQAGGGVPSSNRTEEAPAGAHGPPGSRAPGSRPQGGRWGSRIPPLVPFYADYELAALGAAQGTALLSSRTRGFRPQHRGIKGHTAPRTPGTRRRGKDRAAAARRTGSTGAPRDPNTTKPRSDHLPSL